MGTAGRKQFEIESDNVINELAAKYGKSTHQIMLNWGLTRGYAVIPKSSVLQRQKDNLDCLNFRLTDQDRDSITASCDQQAYLFTGLGHNLFA